MSGRRGVGACVAVAALLAAAAHAGWDETRKELLEPLSADLHKHLPTYARQKDLRAILALYDAGVEPIRERWQGLFRMFETIDRLVAMPVEPR